MAAIMKTLFLASITVLTLHAQDMPPDYQAVLKFLDRAGDYKSNVLRVNIPRNDLKVTVDGVATPTPFGFGGWLALTKGDHGDVMMGDLVLLEEEVNPVMSALLDNGLDVTALHNHFFYDDPRIFYMHVHGHGAPADLARKVKPALDRIGKITITRPTGAGNATLQPGQLDTARIAKIVGSQGDQAGQVYKITIGRDDVMIKEMGATINSRMGLNTWASFVGTDANAAIAGDVAMLEKEVTPVLKALRSNGIQVVAIHHHMTGTSPVVIFLHYWGKGPAEKLATGFRAALDQLGKK
jgi:hypothetical protein